MGWVAASRERGPANISEGVALPQLSQSDFLPFGPQALEHQLRLMLWGDGGATLSTSTHPLPAGSCPPLV